MKNRSAMGQTFIYINNIINKKFIIEINDILKFVISDKFKDWRVVNVKYHQYGDY